MLATVVLPIVLAVIMFSLGIGLTLKDFGRVLTRPRAVLIGAVAQMLETMPVYRLDETDFAQRMFGMVPMDVRVAPGRLEFVMADQ